MSEQRKPFYVHHWTKMVTDIVQQHSEQFLTVCILEIKKHLWFQPLKTSTVTYWNGSSLCISLWRYQNIKSTFCSWNISVPFNIYIQVFSAHFTLVYVLFYISISRKIKWKFKSLSTARHNLIWSWFHSVAVPFILLFCTHIWH